MHGLNIESKDNPKIKHLRGLLEQHSYRKKQQQTVLEGSHLCLAWLQQGYALSALYCTASALSHPDLVQILAQHAAPVYIVPEALYRDLSQLGTSLACMAVVDVATPSVSIQYNVDTLILENVQDPGNVGTLLRSAAAAGVKQILCSQGSAAIWSPRVLRAGMGAQFSLICYEHVVLAEVLPHFETTVYATSSHRSVSLYSQNLTAPCVWIMGNEGQGVSEFALAQAQALTIPQPGGQESLNVAVAGSICLFEMVRQRL